MSFPLRWWRSGGGNFRLGLPLLLPVDQAWDGSWEGRSC
ncbi:hypothetical protein LINPERPRIM_LOCUS35320 [Linum perenne]